MCVPSAKPILKQHMLSCILFTNFFEIVPAMIVVRWCPQDATNPFGQDQTEAPFTLSIKYFSLKQAVSINRHDKCNCSYSMFVHTISLTYFLALFTEYLIYLDLEQLFFFLFTLNWFFKL